MYAGGGRVVGVIVGTVARGGTGGKAGGDGVDWRTLGAGVLEHGVAGAERADGRIGASHRAAGEVDGVERGEVDRSQRVG